MASKNTRGRLRLGVAVMFASAVPLALWLWVAGQTRASALERAAADQHHAVEAVGEHTLKLLDTQALLLDLIDQMASGRDCQALRSDDRLQAFMSLAARKSPVAVALWILNADGHECMGSNPAQLDDKDRSFREYFMGARTAGPGQYYVDRAVIGLHRTIPIFNVVKPRTKTGSFNGVFLVAVDLTSLIEYWDKTLDIVQQQRISLLRRDGATIARSWLPLVPPSDPAIERRVAAALTASQGTSRGHSAVDGRPRVGAWRALPGWNVIVESSVNEDDVLAPWRQSTLVYGVVAIVASALMGTLTWLLLTGRQRLVSTVEQRTRDLRQLTNSLEERVRDEVEAREAALTRLAQAEKLTALGQLAGGIAHDFNNILQVFAGGASLLDKHADQPARIRRLGTMMDAAAARGVSITRRLLTFARRGELRVEAVDILALLDGLEEMLSPTLGASYVIRIGSETGLPPVLTDRGQLETVLVNLATNARDAMPSGGTITFSANLETVPDDRHPAGLASGTYVRLTVEDRGTGMDQTTLARVMEPFFTTKAPGKGTGLGLPMARGFAEQSGGALAVVSELGISTTVTLWLPVTDAPAPSPNEPEHGGPGGRSRQPRVLLVDDEASVREVLAGQLNDSGYDVVQADCGEAALALLDAGGSRGESIDLIISDLTMPGMDGIALIRAAHAHRPHLPAILLTGYAGAAASMALQGAISGSYSLLRKPVSGPQLTDRVATLLEAQELG